MTKLVNPCGAVVLTSPLMNIDDENELDEEYTNGGKRNFLEEPFMLFGHHGCN